MLTKEDIQKQSERAYGQWAPQWREHAVRNAKWPMKSLGVFENSGIGKAVLCVANGYSLEEEIETIKAWAHNVDILCCDKSLGHLVRHGVRPTFCMVADANVDYERYLKPWEHQLQDTVLVANVCANPLWVENGNWRDRYFFAVKDILKSELEFTRISGCPNVIPAGTNVSNGLVVFLTQSDNEGRKNFFAYDKILLIGFDYCWSPTGGYYAFDKDGGGKAQYMRHAFLFDLNREPCYSSSNLIFSAKWLAQYVQAFRLPVVQCTRRSVYETHKTGVLADQMQYSFRTEDRQRVLDLMALRRTLQDRRRAVDRELGALARDHYYSYLQSVTP